MRAVVLVDFHDNKSKVDRKAGEEFVVSRERFEEINSIAPKHGLKEIVGEVVRTETAVGKQSPESRAAKAAKSRKAE